MNFPGDRLALPITLLCQNLRVLLPEIQLMPPSSIRILRKVKRTWHLTNLAISKMVELLITRQGQVDATGNEIENLISTNGSVLRVVNSLDCLNGIPFHRLASALEAIQQRKYLVIRIGYRKGGYFPSLSQ